MSKEQSNLREALSAIQGEVRRMNDFMQAIHKQLHDIQVQQNKQDEQEKPPGFKWWLEQQKEKPVEEKKGTEAAPQFDLEGISDVLDRIIAGQRELTTAEKTSLRGIYRKLAAASPEGEGREGKFRVDQVVALRESDGTWMYAKIHEFVEDGTARLIDVDGRRKLEDLRPLNKREVGR